MSNLRIRVLRVPSWDGPRNSRCYELWERNHWPFEWLYNDSGSHAQGYVQAWIEERSRPERYLLLTEADFLPDVNFKAKYIPELLQGHAICAPKYHTRNPVDNSMIVEHDRAGGWFVLLDKALISGLPKFHSQPDPCNDLPQYHDCRLLDPADAYPEHFGAKYGPGVHLFWSRHYDGPELTAAGFDLTKVRAGVDRALDDYERQLSCLKDKTS